MRGVRRFVETDIGQVAALHQRVFQIKSPLGKDSLDEAYRNYFCQVFFDYPGRVDGIHPLVYEHDGVIVGFLGAVARRFRFQGEPVVGCVCTQFVVDEAFRGMPGFLLVKTLMRGPQEFSFADECTDGSRALWGQLGATEAFCHSAHWYLPIRPASFLAQRARVLRPFASTGDWLISKVPGSPFFRRPKTLQELPLGAQDLAHFHMASRSKLKPDYTPIETSWLLERAAQLAELHGKLEGALLKTAEGEPAGCFLYHRPDDRLDVTTLGEVIHFAACPQQSLEVLQHVFEHARERGVAALAGRVAPDHFAAFSKAQCILHPYTKWFMVHSHNPELQAAVCRGDSMMTPLDGEWCCHFNFRNVNG